MSIEKEETPDEYESSRFFRSEVGINNKNFERIVDQVTLACCNPRSTDDDEDLDALNDYEIYAISTRASSNKEVMVTNNNKAPTANLGKLTIGDEKDKEKNS